MSNHARRVLTPGASRKRKEREGFYTIKASTITSATPTPSKAEPASANRLLAGYLAHEFLTHGTLLGQKWGPTLPDAAAVSSAATATITASAAETKNANRNSSQNGQAEQSPTTRTAAVKHESYADVSNLMKTDGTHIQGIVNPTQLARWLQM